MCAVPPIAVACGLIYRNGSVLAALRGPGRALAHHWEFPGGKLEPGESPASALHRELREELGIEIRILGELDGHLHSDSSPPIRLLPFLCVLKGPASPQPQEHLSLTWVTAISALSLTWAPADLPLVQTLDGLILRAATLVERLHSPHCGS
jgi:8-oxo-dGTP diphosphatase